MEIQMTPRQRFFDCLQRSPPALFEAALWIAAEHDTEVNPEAVLNDFKDLQQRVSYGLPMLPVVVRREQPCSHRRGHPLVMAYGHV